MLHARSDYNARVVDLAGLIPEGEPVFLLRGQDGLAHTVVKYWANLARSHGVSEAVCAAALRHANKMAAWKTHKVADVPEGVGLDGEVAEIEVRAAGNLLTFTPPELEILLAKLQLLVSFSEEGDLIEGEEEVAALVEVIATELESQASVDSTPPQTPETNGPEG